MLVHPFPSMKTPAYSLLAALFLVCAPVAVLLADDPKPVSPVALPRWNVRLEVLMVELSEAKALALLPDLRDDTKIDAACAQLLTAVKNKEAKLVGYPVVYSNDGQRASSLTSAEKVYPTQFDGSASPTSFEKRNMGPALDAECQVSANGEWIQMTGQIQHVELLQFDPYDVSPRQAGGISKIEQPQFYCARDTQELALHSGQSALVGVHKLVKPEGDMELFILRATATAAH